nr:MAG TPA: hypothetical protein [Caudoviricetes sp.]
MNCDRVQVAIFLFGTRSYPLRILLNYCNTNIYDFS